MAKIKRIEPGDPMLVKAERVSGSLKSRLMQGTVGLTNEEIVRLDALIPDGDSFGRLLKEVLKDSGLQEKISPASE